ncbi:membrane protein [Insulibacter thermoxylanivorax]|uniref:Membrane protein n=1 Tax=Insulibacter thermoxylanivorax TaxID=2749268 RepID=A0A916Q9Z4_9BACL|nr:membrane protein [Insulibacter thermoxylanivorax]
MKISFWKHLFRTVIPILLGTAIYAFGLHMFLIPNQFMEGGVTGIAILLNYMFDWPPSLLTLLINIPLFLLGLRFIGKVEMIYTILGTLSLSFFLWVMERFIDSGMLLTFQTEQDFFLATLYAGVTTGLGLGIVFRAGGTTGGSDIIARIAYKLKHWPMGRTMLWIDAAVIGASFFYIPREKILYTFVIVFIATRIIDFIQEGAYAARAYTIITEKGAEMADLITREIDRGVTIIPAKGAYSKQAKDIIYCIVSRSQMHRLKLLVRSVDPRAFIVISEVQDVLGEGFREEH